MSWSFRKSTSLGPFRFNLSRSGIGMSFGVKGARISVNTRGTYVNLGANGIYYRKRISGVSDSRPINNFKYEDTTRTYKSDITHTITTNDVEKVTDVDSLAFIEELESKAKKRPLYKVFGVWPSLILLICSIHFLNEVVKVRNYYKDVFTIVKRSVNIRSAPSKEAESVHKAKQDEKYDVVAIDSSGWVKVIFQHNPVREGFIRADMGTVSNELLRRIEIKRIDDQPRLLWTIPILMLLLIGWCIFLKRLDVKRKTLEIYYTLDEEVDALYQKFLEYFREFSFSKKIWQKLHAEGVADTKYHAGASQLISRIGVKGISYNMLPSPFLKTNVSVPCITLRATQLYFFPERLIIKRGNKFGATFYKNIQITSSNVRFIEEESLPTDTNVIDYTWKYLNKSGGPDKRFNDNRRIPICLYTDYTFQSDNGLYEVITTSKVGAMDNFAGFLKIIGEYQQRTSQ